MLINSLRTYISIALLLVVGVVKGQTYSFRNLTDEDGLAGPSVFDMLQDQKGYIWFATNHGVSRYDGTSFKNFTGDQGLRDQAVINLFEDRTGKIWTSSYSGRLSYIEGDTIVEHPLADTIQVLSNNYHIDNLLLDGSDNIWFTPNYFGLFRISQRGVEEIDLFQGSKKQFDFCVKDFGNQAIACYQTVLDETIAERHSSRLVREGSNYFFDLEVRHRNHSRRKHILKMGEDSFLASIENILFKIQDGRIVDEREYSTDITCINRDTEGNIWIGRIEQGVEMYSDGDLEQEPLHLLEDKTVSMVVQDFEGGYWFSTTSDGVFYVPSLTFKVFGGQLDNKNQQIVSMDSDGHKLYFGTNGKKIFTIDSLDQMKEFSLRDTIYSRPILMCRSNGELWVIGSHSLRYNNVGDPLPIDFSYGLKNARIYMFKRIPKYGYDLIETSPKDILVAFSTSYIGFDNDRINFRGRMVDMQLKIFSLYQDTKNQTWLATMKGLYQYDGQTYLNWGDRDEIFKGRMVKVVGRDSLVLAGTTGQGIGVITPDGIQYLNVESGLNSNSITDIQFQNDSTVWVSTIKGVNRITLSDVKSWDLKVESFNKYDGLPSDKISKILFDKESVWLGTRKGIVRFENENLKKTHAIPRLFIETVRINNRDTILLETYNLNSDQTDLFVGFNSIGYRNYDNIIYSYQLVGVDRSPIYTHEKFVRFPHLASGTYKLVINVGDGNGNWGSHPLEINISIDQPIFKNVYVVTMGGVLALSLLLLMLIQVIKIQKKRVETKRSFLISQQKALSGQMNPHFMFNSLNSIQSFIVGKDEEMTDVYLSNFSSLMRMILENSKEFRISLRRIIKTMKLYMDLEKLRFEDNFHFQIQVADEIDEDMVKLPPMMIQPFLENAIWHGIMPSPRQGHLLLDFQKVDGTYLLCVVEDNGIGRAKAMEIKKRRGGHNSMGIRNVEERIRLFNSVSNRKMNLRFVDLYNGDGEASGTRVELKIPVEF